MVKKKQQIALRNKTPDVVENCRLLLCMFLKKENGDKKKNKNKRIISLSKVQIYCRNSYCECDELDI